MVEHPSPTEIAVAFTEAWTGHDMSTAESYLAEEVVYDGPVNHVVGVRGYVEALERFARAVTGLEIIAVLGDEEQAMIMYEVSTGPFGTLTCGEHLTVRSGKIQTDRLAFDTYAIRMAQAGGAASD